MSLSRVTSLASIGNICVTCQKSPANHGTAGFDKLLLETEPVVHGNNVVLTPKLYTQTSFMPYSTDNRSKMILFAVDLLQTICGTIQVH